MTKHIFSPELIEWSEFINGDHQQSLTLELFDEDQEQDWVDGPEEFINGDISIDFGCKRVKVNVPQLISVTWHDGVVDDMVEGEGLVFYNKFEHIYKTGALVHECLALEGAGYNQEIGVAFWAIMLLFGPEIPISYLRQENHYLCNSETEWAGYQLDEFEKMLTICIGSKCTCAETAGEYKDYLRQ